jgi:hypothetical protein
MPIGHRPTFNRRVVWSTVSRSGETGYSRHKLLFVEQMVRHEAEANAPELIADIEASYMSRAAEVKRSHMAK